VAERLDVAIVGSGPFGLSVAAHLRNLRTRVFGEPMQTWRTQMPQDMLLRSAWQETSLAAPGDAGSIDRWSAEMQEPRVEPLPLSTFLRYAEWFRQSFVPDGDPADVAHIDRHNGLWRIVTAANEEVDSRAVIVAVGATLFVHVPDELADVVPAEFVRPPSRDDLERWRERHVLVVGGGQHALESAALAAQAAAEVELVVRSRIHWFADREPENPRGPLRRHLYRLAYPAVGYGPPGLNRLVLAPDVFAALPEWLRERLTRRALRAGGSPSLRPSIEGRVRVTERTSVKSAQRAGDGVVVELSDGTRREVDDVLVAAGYRFTLDRLGFLSRELKQKIALKDGWPVLDRWFRTSDPSLLFVGYAAEHRFGPLSRFVLGTKFTAARVAELLG
jgi:cation diffusion facilitator CzcD-associated flavoprotein CzcO